jgi:hypothetical protein
MHGNEQERLIKILGGDIIEEHKNLPIDYYIAYNKDSFYIFLSKDIQNIGYNGYIYVYVSGTTQVDLTYINNSFKWSIHSLYYIKDQYKDFIKELFNNKDSKFVEKLLQELKEINQQEMFPIY